MLDVLDVERHPHDKRINKRPCKRHTPKLAGCECSWLILRCSPPRMRAQLCTPHWTAGYPALSGPSVGTTSAPPLCTDAYPSLTRHHHNHAHFHDFMTQCTGGELPITTLHAAAPWHAPWAPVSTGVGRCSSVAHLRTATALLGRCSSVAHLKTAKANGTSLRCTWKRPPPMSIEPTTLSFVPG